MGHGSEENLINDVIPSSIPEEKVEDELSTSNESHGTDTLEGQTGEEGQDAPLG